MRRSSSSDSRSSGPAALSRRRVLRGATGIAAAAVCLGQRPAPAFAQAIPRLHFLVPAGVGGGWDQTARAVAEAVTRTGLAESATLEHVSGGGGSRAINYLLSSGETQSQTLMVTSTPIVLRAVRGARPSYRELQPVAAVIADYAVVAVRADSPYRDFAALAAAVRQAPGDFRIAGGSVRGGMDHIVAAQVFSEASGVAPNTVVYHPYDAGGAALEALRAGHAEVLSSGLGELLEAPSGSVRLLAVTAADRVPDAASLPTFRELGYDVTFSNWRGFFAAPQVPSATVDAHADLLGRMVRTAEWEEIRARHAWQTLYQARAAFAGFLEAEEARAQRLMTALGMA